MKVKSWVLSPDFIPLNPKSRFARRREKYGSRTMSVNESAKVVKSGYVLDRTLLPRVQRYLKDNCNKKYINLEEMADVLQKQYPEYGRKKKIPFRNSVKQGKIFMFTLTFRMFLFSDFLNTTLKFVLICSL